MEILAVTLFVLPLQVTAECFAEIADTGVKLNFELPEDEDVTFLRSLVLIPTSPPALENGPTSSDPSPAAVKDPGLPEQGQPSKPEKKKAKKGPKAIFQADVDPDEIIHHSQDADESLEEDDTEGELDQF